MIVQQAYVYYSRLIGAFQQKSSSLTDMEQKSHFILPPLLKSQQDHRISKGWKAEVDSL